MAIKDHFCHFLTGKRNSLDLMNHDELPTRVKKARLGVFLVCFAFISISFFILQQRSDPLSRYPYGTAEEREVLSDTLDDSQINILINGQIMPDQVIPFVKADGFNILNTLYYDMASKTQTADPAFIVHFVNRYRNYFDLDSLQNMLSWLSYADAVAYFESNISLPLVADNPSEFDAVLTPQNTVVFWRPSDLMEIATGISLRRQAAESFLAMQADAKAQGIDLIAISGFVPYDQQQYMHDYPSYLQGPYGTREEQLGLTVHVEGFETWNEALSSTSSPYQVKTGLQALSQEQLQVKNWLEENSWTYGWIVRYPENKESITQVFYQPFVLRYVTKETAAYLHETGLTLNEYKAQQG